MKKLLIIILVGIMIGFGMYFAGSNSEDTRKNVKPVVLENIAPKPQASTALTNTVTGNVKVGDVSENIWIAAKRFYVFPNGDGVVYILTDIYGKVSETTEAGDWTNQKILYVRFKPTKNDISYIVKDWE